MKKLIIELELPDMPDDGKMRAHIATRLLDIPKLVLAYSVSLRDGAGGGFGTVNPVRPEVCVLNDWKIR